MGKFSITFEGANDAEVVKAIQAYLGSGDNDTAADNGDVMGAVDNSPEAIAARAQELAAGAKSPKGRPTIAEAAARELAKKLAALAARPAATASTPNPFGEETAAVEAPAVTSKKDVNDWAHAVKAKHNVEKVIEILKNFNALTLATLAEAKYGDFVAMCKIVAA
jgi:hypothetical protein